MHAELWKRVAFTLAALLVVRLGIAIPLPGINPEIWMQVFRQQEPGLLGALNQMSGGGLRRLSIIALSIMPYVTAAILVQLFTMVSRRLRALAEGGERGRRTIELYVRCGTVVLTLLQAFGIAAALGKIADVVTYPPQVFLVTTVLTLTAGTLFLVWLAGQITARGIGNGIALLLIVGALAEGPANLARLIEMQHQGILPEGKLPVMAVFGIAFTVLAVAVERARRRVGVRFAERQVGARHIESQSVKLAFKLNPGGIYPALVVPLILGIVLVAAQLVASGLGLRARGDLFKGLLPGQPLYLALSAVAIILFAFVYTAFLHDPERLARQLQSHGGTVAELAPGTPTADYLDDTLSRVTLLGAVYLAAMVLLPIALANWFGVPYAIGGTSLLILVCVTLDIEAQVRALLSQPRQRFPN